MDVYSDANVAQALHGPRQPNSRQQGHVAYHLTGQFESLSDRNRLFDSGTNSTKTFSDSCMRVKGRNRCRTILVPLAVRLSARNSLRRRSSHIRGNTYKGII